MTGRSIASATATQNQTGAWVVDYTLAGSAGSALWDKVAQENFHQLLGIELDGEVYSAPIIQPTQSSFSSFQGRGEISGSLTQQDAQNLAQAMNFGALPVTLKAATSETVSATLGHSALVAGLGAGIAGLILVLLYVLLYYRALGLVVISGLVLTAMLLWAIISALGHTSVAPSFDLAGITGLIVSIGITVDSYIVYFERLKDEARSGRSIRTSVDRGFKSAWRTVWAADFVSLLAAIVLYLVAVGNVKGFAFFLGLSTIMDMAVTWFYTRPLVILLGQSPRLQGEGAFSIATGLGAGPQAQRLPVGAGARRWLVSDEGRDRDGAGRQLPRRRERRGRRTPRGERRHGGPRRGGAGQPRRRRPRPAGQAPARSRPHRPPLPRRDPFRLRGQAEDLVQHLDGHHRLGDRLDRPAGRAEPGHRVQGRDGVDHRRTRGDPDRGRRRHEGHRRDQPDGAAARQREQADAERAVGHQQALAGPAGRGQQERAEGAAAGHRCPCAEVARRRRPRPPATTTTTTKPTTTTTAKAGAAAGSTTTSAPATTTTLPAGAIPKTVTDKISITTVGPTWGSSITDKAIEALIIFFIVVGIYISIRFEPKMALAAFIAMVHDVLIAVGIYSIFGFQVTPDTVVAILTILGYSLYDTVVVFDRVRDNTRGIGSSGRLTYPQLINLSMNQTLARSINTSMVAIIPVLAILLIGAQFLGATTLQSYGLALFVGLLSGAYSSIFIAAPVLSMMKEREERWVAIAKRLAQRGEAQGSYSALDAATMSTQMSMAASGQVSRGAAAQKSGGTKRSGPIRPGSGSGAGGGNGGRERHGNGGDGPAGRGRRRAGRSRVSRKARGRARPGGRSDAAERLRVAG